MRDFFYNKGDVFIAVLIILIAAFVIYLRVGVIMDYSASGSRGESLLPMPPAIGDWGDRTPNAGTDGGSEQNNTDGDATDPSTLSGADGQAGQTPAPQEQPPASSVQVGQPSASSVQITVSAGDAASTIADKLLAAGAISDTQAFISEVLSQDADSKLKIGTFTIPKGSSVSEIIAILVG